MVSTCMRIAAGCDFLCCMVAVMLVEGVGPMGVAGTLEVKEVVEDLGEILNGTFGWLLKLLEL